MPATRTEDLGEFLRALSIPSRSLPSTLDERSRLWRALTADSPVLVLLDDAATEAQVRAVLPGGARRVIATSRAALGGLDDCVRIRLGPLDKRAAESVLLTRGSADETSRHGLDRLITICAGMPLALRLVGARLALAPHLDPEAMARRLGDDASLDGMSSGDRSVTGSIAASVHLLPSTVVQTLTTLAHLGLPSLRDWHLAAIGATSVPAADRLADDLVATGLLDVAPRVRAESSYAIHDLVRAYLRLHGGEVDPASVNRIVAWAVHLAIGTFDSAITRAVPHVLWPDRPAGLGDTRMRHIVGDGRSWFETEWPSLIALIDGCLAAGQPRAAGAVLAAIRQWMTRSGRLEELVAVAERCVAGSASDPLARACAEAVIGSAVAELGGYERALQVISAAMPDLAGADACTIATGWYELGWLHQRLGDSATAVDAYEKSLGLNRSVGNSYGELGCLCALAELLHEQDGCAAPARHYAEAATALAARIDDYRTSVKVQLSVLHALAPDPGDRVTTLQSALRAARANDDRVLSTSCLIALSAAQRESGRTAVAVSSARDAARLARSLRRPDDLTRALTELGRAHQAGGRDTAAVRSWRSALHAGTDSQRASSVAELHALIDSVRAG